MAHWLQPLARCRRCAIDLPSKHGHLEGTCQACEDQSPEFDRAVAALNYVAPWAPLFAQLKFQGATALATPLGGMLASAVRQRGGKASVVLPIPLSAQRMKERGYNQAWLLAAEAARRLGLPARHDVLTRRVHTQRLMSLDAEARQDSIRDAFGIAPEALACVEGQDIALVDDVMTTGATLNAASRVLLAAGARSVSAWVVARTPAPR
jgi:ComF family protein